MIEDLDKAISDNTRDNYQDPYYKISDPANEHEHFKDAQQRLEKRHRAKINKVFLRSIFFQFLNQRGKGGYN